MAEQADVLDEVEDELFRFGRILDREPALRSALTDPSLPAERKAELLEALLGDRVQDATLRPRPRGRPAPARTHDRPWARGLRAVARQRGANDSSPACGPSCRSPTPS